VKTELVVILVHTIHPTDNVNLLLSYVTAKKIKAALEPGLTSQHEIKLLHEKDEDTTWFGILREDTGFPSFQDYGRYASLMAESARSPMSPNGLWNGARDSRCPSLVSFVGETGMLTLKTIRSYTHWFLQAPVKAPW